MSAVWSDSLVDCTAFEISAFTDDFQFEFICPELAAVGAKLWHEQNEKARIMMCRIHKKQLGTVIDAMRAELA